MNSSPPTTFIGSSTEGKNIAEAIQANLSDSSDVSVWSQGVFGLGKGTLETLVTRADEYDFAILVLTPDDLLSSRGSVHGHPRDNVLFELGLFMGTLGRDRTFVVHQADQDLKLPSDLAGVTTASFRLHDNGNLEASVGSATGRIRQEIAKLGRRRHDAYLESLRHNLEEGDKVTQSAFRSYVDREKARFQHATSDWASRSFELPLETNGITVLRSAYASAQSQIFATSDTTFSPFWTTAAGQDLSTAHLQGTASVLRVFVFDTRKSVSKEFYDVMLSQSQIKRVEVRAYFDQEDKSFLFDPDISRDFTVIDNGEAIGVTLKFTFREGENDGDLRARWYFQHEGRRPIFQSLQQGLTKHSESIDDFSKWWAQNRGNQIGPS